MSISRVTLFDFNFISADSMQEIADLAMQVALDNTVVKYNTLITPNAYQIVHYNDNKNRELKDFYKQSCFILPDGKPIVWLSGILAKEQIKHRLAGSDLFPVLWKKIKATKQSVSLVLPKQSVCTLFKNDYPACSCSVPAFFGPSDEKYIAEFVAQVVENIIENKSRFLFLGLGFPKQEILGIEVTKRLKEKGYSNSVLILLLGASFEFYFGLKKRAPRIIQSIGLEWLHRLLSEPRRLWKRYTVDNIRFLVIAIKEIFK